LSISNDLTMVIHLKYVNEYQHMVNLKLGLWYRWPYNDYLSIENAIFFNTDVNDLIKVVSKGKIFKVLVSLMVS
jgi:hypothetical protein